jgi:hypothetical protein
MAKTADALVGFAPPLPETNFVRMDTQTMFEDKLEGIGRVASDLSSPASVRLIRSDWLPSAAWPATTSTPLEAVHPWTPLTGPAE